MADVTEDLLLDETEDNESDYANKVFCANCVHCKLVKVPAGSDRKYSLRVKCEAGKWRKKLGEEKFYKYFTVARRKLDSCDAYEPMGDVKEFIKDLKKSLPINDEVYIQN